MDSRISRRSRRGERGYALMFVFLLAAAAALNIYLELPRVAFESQRLREELLVERGLEYRRAIQLYVRKLKSYPPSIDALEKSSEKRYLRRRYLDPMTGKDEWRLIHIGPNGEFTDSLVMKPEKKEQNQNTFITEGPSIGSTGPQQPGGPTSVGLRQRQSDLAGAAGQGLNPEVQGPGPQQQPGGFEVSGSGGYFNPNQIPQVPTPEQAQKLQQQFQQQQQGQYPQQGQQQPYPGGIAAPISGYPQPQMNQQTSSQQYQQQQGGYQQQPVGYPPPPGQQPPVGFNPMGRLVAPGVTQQQPYGTQTPANSQTGGQVAYPQQYGQQPGQYGQQPGQYGQQPGQYQQGQQPGQYGQQPISTNPAVANQIMNMITRPTGRGPTTGTGMGALGSTLGAGIAGVASKYEAEGIKLINERSKYNEWEFLYDARRDSQMQAGGVNLNTQTTNPGNTVGTGSSSTGSSFGNGSNTGSGFGTGTGSGMGNSGFGTGSGSGFGTGNRQR